MGKPSSAHRVPCPPYRIPLPFRQSGQAEYSGLGQYPTEHSEAFSPMTARAEGMGVQSQGYVSLERSPSIDSLLRIDTSFGALGRVPGPSGESAGSEVSALRWWPLGIQWKPPGAPPSHCTASLSQAPPPARSE